MPIPKLRANCLRLDRIELRLFICADVYEQIATQNGMEGLQKGPPELLSQLKTRADLLNSNSCYSLIDLNLHSLC